MTTNYFCSMVNRDSLCQPLQFDKYNSNGQLIDWEIRTPRVEVYGGNDECEAKERLQNEVNATVRVMEQDGYELRDEKAAKIDLCPGKFKRFANEVSLFARALGYLVEASASSASDSIGNFFVDWQKANLELIRHNRSLGIGYWGTHF